jgi:hypothetical protein
MAVLRGDPVVGQSSRPCGGSRSGAWL